MSRVQHSKDVQIRPNSLPKGRDCFPIVDIDSLSASTPSAKSYPGTSAPTKPSVRNKYIMKRFAHDLTQFALPQMSTNYKPGENCRLAVKGSSISRTSSSSQSSGKSYSEEKQADGITRTICLKGCRYDVVRRIALELRFCEVAETDFWNILWTDSPISLEKAHDMRRLQNIQQSFWGPTMDAQKTNHFPGMHEICRKDRLAKNLNRMQKNFPDDYHFYPRTWTLPADIPELLSYFRTNRNQTIICKPDSGCQGKGIFLVRNLKKMNPFAKLIAQIYIPNPLIIDGFKFDLRLYILITSCDPLRMYIYNEGIARFATVKYSMPNDHNVDVVFMHLTNYSLNKFSQSYVPDPEGSKRKLSTVYGYLLERGFNVEKLVEDIDDIIIKTVMAAQPTLKHFYHASFPQVNPGGSSCFEILGFDVLIDENLKPWLLEVNLSPSFNLELSVDAEVKEALLRDTFHKVFLGTVRDKAMPPVKRAQAKGIVKPSPSPEIEIMDKAGHSVPKNLQKQYYHETLNQGNFRLIYPTDNCYKYAEFLDPELNFPAVNDMAVPISRRGLPIPRYTNDTEESSGATPRIHLQPTVTQPAKVAQVKGQKDPKSTSLPTPRIPLQPKSTAESGSGSETCYVSPFNQVTAHRAFEKGDPSTGSKAQNKKVVKNELPPLKPSVPRQIQQVKGQGHKVKMAQIVDERGEHERIIVNVNDGLSPVNSSHFKQSTTQGKKVRSREGKAQSTGGGESTRVKQGQGQCRSLTSETRPTKNLPPLAPKVVDFTPKSESARNAEASIRNSRLPTPKSDPPTAVTFDAQAQASRPYAPVSKNKLVEEWILNGVSATTQSSRKAKPSVQKPDIHQRWDNFAHETLKKCGTSSVPSSKPTYEASKFPLLSNEEDDRKEMLKERERKIRQMGIEGKIYEMMQETGTLSMEEDLIYSKIFCEKEFMANRNGSSTLLQPRRR